MRVDKFLQMTRIVKRRALAQELCEKGGVLMGDRVLKPASEVRPGDLMSLTFGRKVVQVKVLAIPNRPIRKEEAASYYEIVSVTRLE